MAFFARSFAFPARSADFFPLFSFFFLRSTAALAFFTLAFATDSSFFLLLADDSKASLFDFLVADSFFPLRSSLERLARAAADFVVASRALILTALSFLSIIRRLTRRLLLLLLNRV